MKDSVLYAALRRSSQEIYDLEKFSKSKEGKQAYWLIAEMLDHAANKKQSPLFRRLNELIPGTKIKYYQERHREQSILCVLSIMKIFKKTKHKACVLAAEACDIKAETLRKLVDLSGMPLEKYFDSDEGYLKSLTIEMRILEEAKGKTQDLKVSKNVVTSFAKSARTYMSLHRHSEAMEKEIENLIFLDDEDIIDEVENTI